MDTLLFALIILVVFIGIVVALKKIIDRSFSSHATNMSTEDRVKSLRITAYVLLPLSIASIIYLFYQDVSSFQTDELSIFFEFLTFPGTLIWFIPAILFTVTVAALQRHGYTSKVLNVGRFLCFAALAIHTILFFFTIII